MKIFYKKGVLHIKQHEIDILSIIQTLGVILLIIIAFFQGAQFKKQQTEEIIRYCGESFINTTRPPIPFLTTENTNTNTKINNSYSSVNNG